MLLLTYKKYIGNPEEDKIFKPEFIYISITTRLNLNEAIKLVNKNQKIKDEKN